MKFSLEKIFFSIICFAVLTLLANLFFFYVNNVNNNNNLINVNNIHYLKNVINASKNLNVKIIFNRCNYSRSGPRILCGVYTNPRNHKTKLLAIHNTWGKRYVLIFFYKCISYLLQNVDLK